MARRIESIPTIQLNPNYLAVYSHGVFEETERPKNTPKNDNLTRGNYNGFMSIKTRKEIKGKLTNYFTALQLIGKKYRKEKNIQPTIITLTLPATQRHPDNEIKRECLMRFLENLKKTQNVTFYYWVAEKQKNGNIHFHILADKFVKWQWVRNQWNSRLETLGYISEFEQKHGHRNPNSTDIENIKNIERTARYVSKYTTKIDQQGGIAGRLHGECDSLKLFSKVCTVMKETYNTQLQYLLECGAIQEIVKEHATIYTSTNETPLMEIMKTHAPYLYNFFTDSLKGQIVKMYATN